MEWLKNTGRKFAIILSIIGTAILTGWAAYKCLFRRHNHNSDIDISEVVTESVDKYDMNVKELNEKLDKLKELTFKLRQKY